MTELAEIHELICGLKVGIGNLELKVEKSITAISNEISGQTNMLATSKTDISSLKVSIDGLTRSVNALKATSKPVTTSSSTTIPPPTPPVAGPSGALHVDATYGLTAPKYKSGSMTPNSFIAEVQEYLTLKGTPQSQWHLLVGRFFEIESDIACWWRSKRSSVKTWTDFVSAFKSYEDCVSTYDLQVHTLYTKQQRLDEPFESFAWYLVKTARIIIGSINKIRKLEGKPPLRMRQSDPLPDKTAYDRNNQQRMKSYFKSQASGNQQHKTPTIPASETGKPPVDPGVQVPTPPLGERKPEGNFGNRNAGSGGNRNRNQWHRREDRDINANTNNQGNA
ncbi:unnamed protein product [Orchesella dallaii]|uniref:Activity-regulated cytoskeleton-associated protein n=1 Tax=Orchesella dallaii TaxID=48710 RepID=A0ABP1QP17_9HEXA